MPMNPISLIPLKYRMLALVIAIFASFASGTTIGWITNGWRLNGEIAELNAAREKDDAERQAGQNKMLLRHAEEVAQIKIENDAKNRKVSNDYENRLSVLRADRNADRRAADLAGGLRVPRTICDSAPGQAEAASVGGHHEALGQTIRLPQKIEDGLWSIADDADELREGWRTCQNWIREHGFYGD